MQVELLPEMPIKPNTRTYSMIILEEHRSKDLYELIGVYVADKPYHTGYIKVVPYPKDAELDPTVRPSYDFRVVPRPGVDSDFCRDHDVAALTILNAGLEY
jgi:hypothetical protein